MPEIMFNGSEGRIEGRYHHSDKVNPPVALVLHPHPEQGGTMNNKVVYNTFHRFADNGFSVLRMNFRGVGRSQGKYDQGIGELTDAASALDWLQLQNPVSNDVWISGFSFGAWIAMQLLMRRPEIQGFVAISPPVNKYDFSFLAPCPTRGLIVQGNADSIVTEESVRGLVDKLAKQKESDVTYKMVDGADHFFRTKMDDLNKTIDDHIKYCLVNRKAKKTRPDRRRRQTQVE
ncbi:MAG: alpha/beta hydrolase [Rickettsiales bacterium]